jgi:hypothetical protein
LEVRVTVALSLLKHLAYRSAHSKQVCGVCVFGGGSDEGMEEVMMDW